MTPDPLLDWSGQLVSSIALTVSLCAVVGCSGRIAWLVQRSVIGNRPYVINYCLANLLLCCFSIPVLIIDIAWYLHPATIVVGLQALQLVLTLASLWAFMLMCFERHCFIADRLHYDATFKGKHHNCTVFAVVWLLAGLSAVPLLVTDSHAPLLHFAQFKTTTIIYSVYVSVLLQCCPCLGVLICLVKCMLAMRRRAMPSKYFVTSHGHWDRGLTLAADAVPGCNASSSIDRDHVTWLKWIVACVPLRFAGQLSWTSLQIAKVLQLTRNPAPKYEVWLLVLFLVLVAWEVPLLCLVCRPPAQAQAVIQCRANIHHATEHREMEVTVSSDAKQEKEAAAVN